MCGRGTGGGVSFFSCSYCCGCCCCCGGGGVDFVTGVGGDDAVVYSDVDVVTGGVVLI